MLRPRDADEVVVADAETVADAVAAKVVETARRGVARPQPSRDLRLLRNRRITIMPRDAVRVIAVRATENAVIGVVADTENQVEVSRRKRLKTSR